MPNYYNKNTFERKDIDQELIDLWISTDNPKYGEYVLTPIQPRPDAIWGMGYWIIPEQSTFTANEWLEKEGYGATQLVTLLDLFAQLQAAERSSIKMNAVKTWTNQILAQYINNPEPKVEWSSAPFGFNETVIEAYNELASQSV